MTLTLAMSLFLIVATLGVDVLFSKITRDFFSWQDRLMAWVTIVFLILVNGISLVYIAVVNGWIK